jgi:glycosyltransferase involved in cell wall biosynthesis
MRQGKITHLIDGLGAGGAERLLVAYAPRLVKLGYDVEVVVLQERGAIRMQDQLTAAGIPVRRIPVDNLRRVDQVIGFHREMKRSGRDLLHAHLEFASMLSAISAHMQHKAMVATLHTLDAPEAVDRNSFRRWLMYKTLERYADTVICLTKANAEIARQTGLGDAAVEILPNGIEVDQFGATPTLDRAAIRGQFGIPLDATGLDRLLQALPAVRARTPDAHLLIVGEGPEMDRLTGIVAAEGLTEFVHFAGYRSDVSDIMQASDVFVLPTMFDAQPTVIIEAMASSLPVVSTTFAGVPDMVTDGEHGLLVPPDDVPALTEALARVIGDPELARRMGRAGRARAEAEFAIDRQIERLADIYDALIAKRRRAA